MREGAVLIVDDDPALLEALPGAHALIIRCPTRSTS